MREKGVMGDNYQVMMRPWKKTPKRCSAEGKLYDFILIDDDDVIILDFPESWNQKFKSSGGSRDRNKFPLQGVISIDDDESNSMRKPGTSVKDGGADLDSNTPASDFPQRSTELDGDECQVIQEEGSTFRFSKCKETSRKARSRNHFGLCSESESGSLEGEFSDCEVIEGSSREVREQWEKAFLRKRQNASKSSGFHDEASPCVPKPNVESLSECQCNEIISEDRKSDSVEAEEPVIGHSASTSGDFHGGDSITAERETIIGREKLKETDEYKRAVEAEWASRQQQLQIQAEEAQRLRKRRKAESMRRLDMERRQKQRLEEVRETQKKDEENLNLKEQLRAEVRKELNKLESSCIDMASLLRSLDIPVGGGIYPLSHEVRAAYKRALLKFHPDRASGADIRLQVEAEEKFKLISRMKEKFLSPPHG